jgi:hypothetical protein
MLKKGIEAYRASVLLEAKMEKQTELVLYLLLVSFELTAKALLLFSDFSKHSPRLQRRYGHRLVPLVRRVYSAYPRHGKRRRLPADLVTELRVLSARYPRMRYGELTDILVDPSTYSSRRIRSVLKATIYVTLGKLERKHRLPGNHRA